MVKPRENRVPIMMSDDELTAIDDWRFANRVATRSDAVRRLVQIGLLFDEHADAVTDTAVRLYERYNEKVIEMASALNDDAMTIAEREDAYVKANFNHQMDTIHEIASLLHMMGLVLAPLQAMKESSSFENAQFAFLSAKAESVADLLDEKIRQFEFRRDHGLLPGDSNKDAEK